MRDWVVIQLVAPMASFGELAGNARRGGRDRPGRGALLGLLGAALGVRREDDAGQAALAHGYDVAVRTLQAIDVDGRKFSTGDILQDYHTIQSLPNTRKARTRADALVQKRDLVTSITVREYRCDVFHEAAFGLREGARWGVETLRDALLRPTFALWLGRKSCTFSAPLDPRIVAAATPEAAFEVAEAKRPATWADALGVGDLIPISIAVEGTERPALTDRTVTAVRRRDAPVDRRTWCFVEREELVYTPQSMRDGGAS